MKRTNEAFKDEVFRRYRTEVHNRRNLRIYMVSIITAFLLVSGLGISLFTGTSLPKLVANWFDSLREPAESNDSTEPNDPTTPGTTYDALSDIFVGQITEKVYYEKKDFALTTFDSTDAQRIASLLNLLDQISAETFENRCGCGALETPTSDSSIRLDFENSGYCSFGLDAEHKHIYYSYSNPANSTPYSHGYLRTSDADLTKLYAFLQAECEALAQTIQAPSPEEYLSGPFHHLRIDNKTLSEEKAALVIAQLKKTLSDMSLRISPPAYYDDGCTLHFYIKQYETSVWFTIYPDAGLIELHLRNSVGNAYYLEAPSIELHELILFLNECSSESETPSMPSLEHYLSKSPTSLAFYESSDSREYFYQVSRTNDRYVVEDLTKKLRSMNWTLVSEDIDLNASKSDGMKFVFDVGTDIILEFDSSGRVLCKGMNPTSHLISDGAAHPLYDDSTILYDAVYTLPPEEIAEFTDYVYSLSNSPNRPVLPEQFQVYLEKPIEKIGYRMTAGQGSITLCDKAQTNLVLSRLKNLQDLTPLMDTVELNASGPYLYFTYTDGSTAEFGFDSRGYLYFHLKNIRGDTLASQWYSLPMIDIADIQNALDGSTPPVTEPPVTESPLPIMPTPSTPGLTCSPDAFDRYMDKPIMRITYRMRFEEHTPEQLISLNASYVKDLTDRLKALKLTAITNDIFWYAPGPYVYMEFQDGSGAILMLDSIGAELYVSVYDVKGNRTVAQWYSLPESEMASLCTALKGYIPSDHAPSETCSHRNTTSEILVEATCTSEGLKVIRCTKCGDYYVLKIAIPGHDYADATCTIPRTCRGCGKTAGELLQHSYTVSQSKDATCTAEGSITYTCNLCGDSYTEKIPMLPHDYGNAPCTASKTCIICGNVKEGTDSHSYQISDSIDATCNQEGYKVYTCTKCGDSYTEKFPQTTHVYADAACYAPKTCTICHDTIGEALGHTYQNGVCTSCGLIQYSSEGLQFWLNADGKSYHLDSLGTCTDTEVIVPNVHMGLPVTKINNLAFYYSNVTKVVLPDTIKSIERGAFCNCYYLESITLPKGLIEIGEIAFSSCEVLTEINIPDSVTTIGDRAFQNCNKLTSVVVPNSVTSLGQGIFQGSENLKSVTLPTHLTEIKNYMFQSCSSLVNVTISDGVTSLGDRVFMGCAALKKITLPNSVQSIGADAFQNCTSLESITLPDKLTSLPKNMFKKCTSLKSITIPVGVVEIPAYAFAECESLQSVTIPNTVTSISSHAFTKCTGLKTIVIPNSVKALNESVFEGCTGLESITLSNQLTSLSKNLFKKCTGLKNFTIPVGIVEIREYAFAECESLENVTISNTVEQIYDYAFTKCTSLKKITVPDTVEVLYKGVFADCTALESVTLSKNNIRINHYLFQNCTDLKNINLPDTVNLIEEYAFYGSGLESITIPNKVARIGNYAFAECKSLTHVTIPDIVSTLGTEAFAGCENLQYVVIPSSVYQIGQKVFKNTPALQAIYCDLSGPTNSWSTKWLNECTATVYWQDQWE